METTALQEIFDYPSLALGLNVASHSKDISLCLYYFQRLSTRTMRLSAMEEWTIGLVGESAEVLDCLKKVLFHDHPLDQSYKKILTEIGDTLWYLSAIATELGIDINTIADLDSISKTSEPMDVGEWAQETVARCISLSRDAKKAAQIPTSNNKMLVRMGIYDVLVRVQILCLDLNLDFTQALVFNAEKLQERYPDGFSAKASLFRCVK
ncbi:nucleoside triphosphate pyrophosphohydrolase family protein [Geoalkalibacter subterraneus]|uniref:nucleoside triphosphate pyrophosphohydrolase family protein n=1 Tax=Geoalkalibacter subterraneus TaxID=483547 RepID=UPI0006932B74|nr:nucleoside triphosphate pyrophosphohydrolase family protein [Geoalkalibacter subterraneus]